MMLPLIPPDMPPIAVLLFFFLALGVAAVLLLIGLGVASLFA